MTKIQPIFNLKGVATHAVILSTEITPFKLAQQTLETHARELGQANAELTSANRAKSEFLSMMSHELRTPLNTVLTLSESLEEGIYGEVTSLQASRLKMVHSSGTHLLSIINDILDYSKIDSGQLDLYPEITEIDELCKIALQSIRPQMARKKQRLTTTIADGGEVILIDQHRVHQILTNLLSNAVKFTPDGGNIGLEVSLENHGSALRMTVWDSGIGIPNDQLQTIFQPFVQLDSSLDRRYEGTGLGLTSVQRLVERMGGSVGVSSQPGEGSRFWVFLPVTGPAAPPVDPTSVDQASQPAEAGDQEVEGTQNRLILLVEDNLDTLNALQDVLEAHHFRVISACNGLEAIRQAEAAQPDLILMDIQMPGMNGLEATHRLRANKTFASTPIIALTALVTPGDRERCLEAGVNEYFTKPVQIKTLLVSIAALLKSGPEQPHTSQS